MIPPLHVRCLCSDWKYRGENTSDIEVKTFSTHGAYSVVLWLVLWEDLEGAGGEGGGRGDRDGEDM